MVIEHPYNEVSWANVIKSAIDYLALLEARSMEAVKARCKAVEIPY